MGATSTHTSPVVRHAVTAAKFAIRGVLLAVLFSRFDTARLWASARDASLVWRTPEAIGKPILAKENENAAVDVSRGR